MKENYSQNYQKCLKRCQSLENLFWGKRFLYCSSKVSTLYQTQWIGRYYNSRPKGLGNWLVIYMWGILQISIFGRRVSLAKVRKSSANGSLPIGESEKVKSFDCFIAVQLLCIYCSRHLDYWVWSLGYQKLIRCVLIFDYQI